MSLTFKRHYPLLVLLVSTGLILTLVLGNVRIIAYSQATDTQSSSQTWPSTSNYTNEIALFDEAVVHNIQIMIPEADYEEMITSYQETGEKDYFHADVIIDDVRVNNVGLRLKGNASLRTMLGESGRQDMPQGQMPGSAGGGGNKPAGNAGGPPPGGQAGAQPPGGDCAINAEGENQRAGPPQGGMPPASPRGDLPAGQNVDKSKIPLLIKFDEYVSGQTYQEYRSVAIRTSGISTEAAMLQEPLTNYVVRSIGLPATKTAFAGVQLKGEEEKFFTSGAMTQQIEKYTSLIHQANPQRQLVVLKDYDNAVNKVMDFLSKRSDYLLGALPVDTMMSAVQ